VDLIYDRLGALWYADTCADLSVGRLLGTYWSLLSDGGAVLIDAGGHPMGFSSKWNPISTHTCLKWYEEILDFAHSSGTNHYPNSGEWEGMNYHFHATAERTKENEHYVALRKAPKEK
jgi:hypothetical protein